MLPTPLIVMLIGFGMVVFAWAFFRRPGTEFWIAAPIWRAPQYLLPIGTALWLLGCIVGLVGVTMWVVSKI